jgi:hypothetical protein
VFGKWEGKPGSVGAGERQSSLAHEAPVIHLIDVRRAAVVRVCRVRGPASLGPPTPRRPSFLARSPRRACSKSSVISAR